ncbi:MAG: DUF2092 domain-containing protein, partial [Planctomycetota bacterium]
MEQTLRFSALLTCAAVLVLAGCAERANIEPRADQTLKSMCETVGDAESLSFHAEGFMDEELESGQQVQLCRKSKISLRRPNKLFVETEGDDLSRSVWYDGKSLTVLDNIDNAYASVEVPGTIEDMLDFVIEQYGLTIPVADFLFRKPYESLTAELQSGRYVGRDVVGEDTCDHLAFRGEMVDWQIWIDAAGTPVPRKFVITYTQEDSHPHYSVT